MLAYSLFCFLTMPVTDIYCLFSFWELRVDIELKRINWRYKELQWSDFYIPQYQTSNIKVFLLITALIIEWNDSYLNTGRHTFEQYPFCLCCSPYSNQNYISPARIKQEFNLNSFGQFPKALTLFINIGKIRSTINMIISWKKGIKGECL